MDGQAKALKASALPKRWGIFIHTYMRLVYIPVACLVSVGGGGLGGSTAPVGVE